MSYWRQAARLPRPSTRTRRRISAQFSMSVNTQVPRGVESGMGWFHPQAWPEVREESHGRHVFRPPAGHRPALRFSTAVHMERIVQSQLAEDRVIDPQRVITDIGLDELS